MKKGMLFMLCAAVSCAFCLLVPWWSSRHLPIVFSTQNEDLSLWQEVSIKGELRIGKLSQAADKKEVLAAYRFALHIQGADIQTKCIALGQEEEERTFISEAIRLKDDTRLRAPSAEETKIIEALEEEKGRYRIADQVQVIYVLQHISDTATTEIPLCRRSLSSDEERFFYIEEEEGTSFAEEEPAVRFAQRKGEKWYSDQASFRNVPYSLANGEEEEGYVLLPEEDGSSFAIYQTKESDGQTLRRITGLKQGRRYEHMRAVKDGLLVFSHEGKTLWLSLYGYDGTLRSEHSAEELKLPSFSIYDSDILVQEKEIILHEKEATVVLAATDLHVLQRVKEKDKRDALMYDALVKDGRLYELYTKISAPLQVRVWEDGRSLFAGEYRFVKQKEQSGQAKEFAYEALLSFEGA